MKIFKFNDEPSAKGISKEEAEKYSKIDSNTSIEQQFEESRSRERMHEKTSIIQERERGKMIRKKLDEMFPDIEYLPPLECSKQSITTYGEKSEERERQKKRESSIFAVQYLKEAQIPISPKESEERFFNEASEGVLEIKILTPKKKLETKIDVSNLFKLVAAESKPVMTQSQLLAQALLNTTPLIQQLPQRQPVVNNTNASKKYSSVDEMPKPPNYKTVPCRLFHSSVGCTRGEYCHFVHNPQFAGREIPINDAPKKRPQYNPQGYNGMMPFHPMMANMGGPEVMMYPPEMFQPGMMYGPPPSSYFIRPPQNNNADYDKRK